MSYQEDVPFGGVTFDLGDMILTYPSFLAYTSFTLKSISFILNRHQCHVVHVVVWSLIDLWPCSGDLIYIIFSGLQFLCTAGNSFHTRQGSMSPQVDVPFGSVTLDWPFTLVPLSSLTYTWFILIVLEHIFLRLHHISDTLFPLLSFNITTRRETSVT